MFENGHSGAMIAATAIKSQACIARGAYHACGDAKHHMEMNIAKQFGRGVDVLRRRHGITKKELALATDIDAGNLNRIISGQQWPTEPRMQALSDYFCVPVSEIFKIGETGDDYFQPSPDQVRKLRSHLIEMIDSISDDQIGYIVTKSTDTK